MRNIKLLPLIWLFKFTEIHAATSPSVPAFRATSPDGQTNIIIGTMHVPHPALQQPALSILDGARAFVIEHTTHDEKPEGIAPEALAGMLENRDIRAAWAREITPSQLTTILKRYNCAAPTPLTEDQLEMLLKLRTARLLSMIAYLPCAERGMRSRDDMLADAAATRHVPTVSLETQQEVSARRNNLPPRLYEASLHHALNTDIDELYDLLVAALNEGNFEEVGRLATEGIKDTADREFFTRTMINERNLAWMPQLVAELKKGDTVVAVGAAHLPGKQGILTLLSKLGFRITPIALQATPLK